MARSLLATLSVFLGNACASTAATPGSITERRLAQNAAVEQQFERLRQDAASRHPSSGARAFDHWLAESPSEVGSPDDTLLGTTLGHWRLIRKIGEGGMGQVWLAGRSDGLYDAQAAIKLLRVDIRASSMRARFARERAVLSRLDHPAIARLLDAGVENDVPYLVLEYVDGLALLDHARAHCPYVGDRVELIMQMAAAVNHAHSLLVVHRDLKPSNVLVTASGQVKLLDFGIAGLLGGQPTAADLTHQSGVGMTPGYAAPEQVLGQPISTATDVFALGTVLFELLTGALPFGSRDMPRAAVEHAVLHDEPRRLVRPDDGVPLLPPAVDLALARGDLEAIVAKALRKDPAQRYQHVDGLIDDLDRWRTHRPISVRRHDRSYRLWLWLRRNRVVVSATAVVLASLGAGLALTAWNLQRSSTMEARSERVIDYLSELLASANPDRRTQRVPTVLEVLDRSRSTLDKRFQDDPETYARLLDVLSSAYSSMARPDVALTMMQKFKAIVIERHGAADPRSVQVQLKMARLYKELRLYDDSRNQFTALLPLARQMYGEHSPLFDDVLSDTFSVNVQTGRLDEAERVLAMSKTIVLALPAGDPGRSRYDDNRALLSAVLGRFAEARVLILHGESSANQLSWLDRAAMQRHFCVMSVRLGDYRNIESTLRALVKEFDAGIGSRANLDSAYALYEIARLDGDTGRYVDSLRTYEEIVQRFEEGGMDDPAAVLTAQAFVLRAQARTGLLPLPKFRHVADELLAQVETQRTKVGYPRLEVWQAIAYAALAMDDAELARRTLSKVQSDRSMDVTQDALLSHELSQLYGELARLQGDLGLSRAQLQAYVRGFHTYPDRAVPEVWSGMLDLAYTQVLLHDPDAANTLQQASSLRPAQMPAGNPLDAVANYLAIRLKQGDNAPATLTARKAIEAAQHRPVDVGQAGMGSLGGAFF